MATIVAVRSGNWSDTSHVTGPWPGGSTPTTKPGVGDTVQTAAYIVTIDEDVTVALLESTSTGYFSVPTAPTLPAVRAIVADVLNSGNSDGALNIGNSDGLVTLTGDVTGGGQFGGTGLFNTGIMGNVTGNVTGGAWSGRNGIKNEYGTIGDIVGAVTGGTGDACIGVFNVQGTIGNITGDVTGGGEDCWGIFNQGGTIGDITGDVTRGSGNNAYGIYNQSGTIGNITGNIFQSINNEDGTIGNIIGDVTGGSVNNVYGIFNTSDGTMGTVDGSLICLANGLFPIYGLFRMVDNPANAITVISSTDTPLTFSNDYPAEVDVKDGVDYNRGTMTGELAAGGSIGPVSIVIGGGGIRIS